MQLAKARVKLPVLELPGVLEGVVLDRAAPSVHPEIRARAAIVMATGMSRLVERVFIFSPSLFLAAPIGASLPVIAKGRSHGGHSR
jgi:hypothetical protein